MNKPLHEMDSDEITQQWYRQMSDEERQANIFPILIS